MCRVSSCAKAPCRTLTHACAAHATALVCTCAFGCGVQATVKEVWDAMEADPFYSPFLDRRPQTTDGRKLTRWQKQVIARPRSPVAPQARTCPAAPAPYRYIGGRPPIVT